MTKPTAYAIRNNQGYWCGIWHDEATARSVLAKGQPSHGETIVPLYEHPAGKSMAWLDQALNEGDGVYRP